MSIQGPEFYTEEGIIRRRLEGMDESELVEYAKEEMRRLEEHRKGEERRRAWEEKVERDNNPAENAATRTKGKGMEEKTKPATLENLTRKLQREGLSATDARRNAAIIRGQLDALRNAINKKTMVVSATEIYKARRASAQR